MHRFAMPSWAVDRVVGRLGRAHPFEDLDPGKTALLVVDLQNAFMLDGAGHNVVPMAREIVPDVNRLAAAGRAAGATVVWIQTTATDDIGTTWSVYDELSSREQAERRKAALRRGAHGHALWAALEVQPNDLRVEKTRFSAFLQDSSDLEQVLRTRGIDTVLIAGTVTGVCCESTARDAMMRNFRVLMISDANAAKSDEEHAAALTAFYTTFGDVMTIDEVLARLDAGRARSAA